MQAFHMIALYFTGNGETGVHMASTDDGWTWQAEASSIIKPPPAMLMRDPHLTMFKDESVLVFTTGCGKPTSASPLQRTCATGLRFAASPR